jgi:hypothetical protein
MTISGLPMTDAVQESEDLLERLQPIARIAQIMNCSGQPHICGTEAACQEVEDSTSRCICPHDKSPPTADLKCPNRVIGKHLKDSHFLSFSLIFKMSQARPQIIIEYI